MCLFGSCAPVHTQKNLVWCFACRSAGLDLEGHKARLSSIAAVSLLQSRLTCSAFPPSLRTTLFYQMGAVRPSCSFFPFRSDHFSSVSPKAIIIPGVWGAALCSAILTLPRIFSVGARPCSHVELWENCVVAEVGSVGSDCLGGVSRAPYGIGRAGWFTRWTVPWSRGEFGFKQCPAGSMAAAGSEALPVQGSFTLLQLYPCGIVVSICIKLRIKIKPWLQRVHFEWQHLACCRKIWPSLPWLFFPGLGLPLILSA